MKRITFLLSVLFIYPVSVLPFSILYLSSDLMYLVVYKILGYRKKVVLKNLEKSFPEKSKNEINRIMRRFYHHLFDVFAESVKTYSVSKKAIARRLPVMNPEVFDKYYKRGQDIIVVTSHYGNWEWAGLAVCLSTPYNISAVYHPLTNPWFDKMVRRNRAKFGLNLVPVHEVARHLRKAQKGPGMTIFVADQSPSNLRKSYWMTFMNQDTPVNFATERLAQITNRPVLFGSIVKQKRGFYQIFLQELVEDPSSASPFSITEKHTHSLEELIRNEPAYWLWSHRRWKHKRPNT